MTSLLNGDKTLYMTKNWWNTVYDKRYVRSDFEKKEKKRKEKKRKMEKWKYVEIRS